MNIIVNVNFMARLSKNCYWLSSIQFTNCVLKNYLTASLVAWYISCDEKLFVLGKVILDGRLISRGPLPSWTVMDQVISSSNELLM